MAQRLQRRSRLKVLTDGQPDRRTSTQTNAHILGRHLVGPLHRNRFSLSMIHNRKEGLVGYFYLLGTFTLFFVYGNLTLSNQ